MVDGKIYIQFTVENYHVCNAFEFYGEAVRHVEVHHLMGEYL